MDIFNEITETLIANKIENPRLEARIILAHIFNCSPSEVHSGLTVTLSQKSQIEDLVNLRIRHYPLDKIIGKKWFYKHEFVVSKNVLSPRPDTEILVEEAAKIIRSKQISNLLDLGTGSGCILCSLAAEFKHLKAVGIDKSPLALQVAKTNIKNLGLEDRCSLMFADWEKLDFCKKIGAQFDMIVSNPPYIATGQIENLEKEVKNHDPILALDGGYDGLKCYRILASKISALLFKKGYVLLEIGIGQEKEVTKIFATSEFKLKKMVADLAGINRCLIFQKDVA